MGWLDRIAVRQRPQQVYVLDPSQAGFRERFRFELRKAVLGAVEEIDGAEDADKLRRVAQPWQLEALGYRTRLGEVRYAADFYARPMRRLKWYVAEISDDQQEEEWEPTENADAIAAWARVRDPGGGRDQMVTNYARLAFCTGEALALYTPEHEEHDEEGGSETCPESWEVLSQMELRPQPDGTTIRYRGGGSEGEPLVPDSRVYRIWQRDTAYSDLADAPLRAVLDLCEELAILTLVVRARAVSRLAGNGLLFIPNEITLAPQQPTPVPDDNMQADPILGELIRSFLAPIEDQGSASSVMPVLLRGPAEAGEKIRHITTRDVTEVFPENALREQTIKRLALSLDMPPESLLGVSDSNHWNAWQIERDAWRHAEPVARQFASDMTAAYLQPTLRDAGVEGWQRYVIAYDASEILTNPDRGQDALDALKAGAIGYAAYRKAMGWIDDDAPTPEDLAVMVMFFGRGTTAAVGAEDPSGAPAEGETTQPEQGAPEQDEEGGADQADTGAESDMAARADALLAACDMAILRHREIAGAKIRSRAASCEPCAEQIANVGNAAVAATLGPDACADLGADLPDVLVRSREQTLAQVAVQLGLGDRTASALAGLVEEHAARTLFAEVPPRYSRAKVLALLDGDGR